MKNIKRAKTELIDRGFSQKIADKYINLRLFTTNFSPIISTKRIIPRMRWLELVYALPYLVLRREILNSFKKTKNVFASVKQIWNILVHLEFPFNKYITTRLHRFSRESRVFYFESSSMELAQPVSRETAGIEAEKESAVPGYQVPVVTTQLPVVSYKPSAVSYKNQASYIPPGTSDFITPLFSYYSFKPTFFLSQKTVPVMPRGASLAQKSDAVYRPYGLLEKEALQNEQKMLFHSKLPLTKLTQPLSHETSTTGIETEKESAVTPQPPLVSHKPSAISYKNQETYIHPSTIDFTTPSEPLEREALENEEKIISYFKPSSMKLAQSLSQETAKVETEKELAVTNYQLPVVIRLLSTLSHKPASVSNKSVEKTSILPSTSDFITPLFSYYSTQKIKTDVGEKTIYDILPYFNFMNNKQTHSNISGVGKAPLYHTYPKIEHVTSTHTEIIKERVIEKEEESKPPHATPQLPSIDLNRLTDQIYQMMERKIRIERERRGLYG